MKHVQLSVLVCIGFFLWGSNAYGEDVSPLDAEAHTADSSGTVEQADDCLEEDASDCPGIGLEADALPAAGSVPLDALGESIEKGEEQFSGCRANTGPPLSSGLLVISLVLFGSFTPLRSGGFRGH